MKTVTGKIVSSKPVSISKAASVLSKFVSAETGASQAVTAYLRRATIAIDELVRLHSKPDRKKHKKQKLDPSAYVKKELLEDNVKDEGKSVNEVKEERSEGERKKKKKEKEKERSGEGKMGIGIKEEEKSQVESNLGEEIKRKKDKKRRERDNFEESGGEIGNKMKIKEEEYDGKMVIEEEKKKQKRKSREVDDEESSDKKKKKKKRKEDN